MFLLEGNDNILVAFRKQEILKMPYVIDCVSQAELDADKFNEPVPVTGMNSVILEQIRFLLETQSVSNKPFETIPHMTSIMLNSTQHSIPTYLIKPRNYSDLLQISAYNLIQLFDAASFLGCKDLRHGICYEILVRLWNDNAQMKYVLNRFEYVERYLNYFQKSMFSCL